MYVGFVLEVALWYPSTGELIALYTVLLYVARIAYGVERGSNVIMTAPTVALISTSTLYRPVEDISVEIFNGHEEIQLGHACVVPNTPATASR
jgi:hypothetical protein